MHSSTARRQPSAGSTVCSLHEKKYVELRVLPGKKNATQAYYHIRYCSIMNPQRIKGSRCRPLITVSFGVSTKFRRAERIRCGKMPSMYANTLPSSRLSKRCYKEGRKIHPKRFTRQSQGEGDAGGGYEGRGDEKIQPGKKRKKKKRKHVVSRVRQKALLIAPYLCELMSYGITFRAF